MGKKIIYGEEGARFETNFEIILKLFLLLIHKTVKMVSSVAEGISVRCLKHRHMPE